MNFKEKLLFTRNKNNTFEDKTFDFASASFDGEKYIITYKSNPLKEYKYQAENVAWCVYSENLNPNDYEFTSLKSVKPKILNNIQEVLVYQSDNSLCDDRLGVLFQSKPELSFYAKSEIEIKKCASSYQVFCYLKEICEAIKPHDEEEEKREYLSKQFKWLHFLDETVAAIFLDPESNLLKKYSDESLVLYPFGSNLSQMQAINNALTNQLCLIEGPPGTGKTQTILNILANLIIQDKTSLMVSPNNEATRNVSRKLSDLNYGFLVAELGKKDNCKKFIVNQPEYPSDLRNWNYTQTQISKAKSFIIENNAILKDIYKRQQVVAKLKTALNEWNLEYKYFRDGYKSINPLSCRSRVSIEQIKELRDKVNSSATRSKNIHVIYKLRASILWGIGKRNDYKLTPVDFELSANRTLFESQIQFLQAEIMKQETILGSYNVEKLQQDITKYSQLVLKSYLYEKYEPKIHKTGRQKFMNPWEVPTEFRAEYPVITSTTNAARNQIGKNGELFDYVIIDESSQADLVTGMLALSSAKNAVVVGDTKQLPCVITDEEKHKCKSVDAQMSVVERYSYTEQSLLSSLDISIKEGYIDAPIELLREHYRCHPDIIGFCNQMFYNNELIVMSQDDGLSAKQVLFVASTNDQNYDRVGNYNRQQAGLFRDDVLPIFMQWEDKSKIGVATPYRVQADKMREWDFFDGIEIDTVHSYQGREKDAVAFITRSNDINDFINNPNLINVAVSRAKRRFALIVSPKIASGENNIADLCRYIKYHGGTIVESTVSSTFDLIYPNKKEERETYLASKGYAQSEQYSEIQAEEWIQESLKSLNAEIQFGYLRNYPLKQFLMDLSPFDDREKRFINTSAHADFLFYRKSDKSIVFNLEVNGRQHINNPEQRRRDALKKSILSKVDIASEELLAHDYNPKEIVYNIIKKHYSENEDKTAVNCVVQDDNHPWDKYE
jgi:DNA polymerase III delta prime subunit